MAAVSVDFHRVIVRAPSEDMSPGWRTIIPPVDAFDPLHVRVTPVAEVRAGDTVIGTIQPHYDHLLNPLDRAQWVSYFSHASRPQTVDARPFDPRHCYLCAHNGRLRQIGADSGWWTVDGCTTYRPDSLLLIVPRELA
ncbi:predicted protein [Streptomyces viridosporus ATCC 14672]|uniref:Predicted protein n=1 Tax=Streptomyces viridosporus (strain ATCC 14672 / DSM 40746 / JCM 4963 / KCTC 9882 / NRRL B-12104 / FH 1290) TaxID=566461 RepID=D6A4E7_STRV1|nr:hypothetical protein [Streptomyces viridosporus]EFE65787.1 predicted protein [Streptomyces viridosporus ATCC 14672]